MTEPEMVVGDEVILTSKIKHFLYPDRYPEPGTIGKIERVYNHTIVVRWPIGSTCGNVCCQVEKKSVIVVSQATNVVEIRTKDLCDLFVEEEASGT